MHTIRTMAAQGDLLIRRVEAIPTTPLETIPAFDGVVAHSETGHHHRLLARSEEGHPTSTVCYLRADAEGMRAYIEIGPGGGCDLVHERPWDTHAPLHLTPGTYELRRQREHTPEGWRRVED